MWAGFSLGSYLPLVNYAGRFCRTSKARISLWVAGTLERLGISPEFWQQRLKRMFAKGRLMGSYFAANALYRER